ncbi:hypothetical protein BC940DRAFT_297757 [Gongronella butleri]|nr:hypothetical protein BC940DRAFT_297757 [Gongronella butleri]
MDTYTFAKGVAECIGWMFASKSKRDKAPHYVLLFLFNHKNADLPPCEATDKAKQFLHFMEFLHLLLYTDLKCKAPSDVLEVLSFLENKQDPFLPLAVDLASCCCFEYAKTLKHYDEKRPFADSKVQNRFDLKNINASIDSTTLDLIKEDWNNQFQEMIENTIADEFFYIEDVRREAEKTMKIRANKYAAELSTLLGKTITITEPAALRHLTDAQPNASTVQPEPSMDMSNFSSKRPRDDNDNGEHTKRSRTESDNGASVDSENFADASSEPLDDESESRPTSATCSPSIAQAASSSNLAQPVNISDDDSDNDDNSRETDNYVPQSEEDDEQEQDEIIDSENDDDEGAIVDDRQPVMASSNPKSRRSIPPTVADTVTESMSDKRAKTKQQRIDKTIETRQKNSQDEREKHPDIVMPMALQNPLRAKALLNPDRPFAKKIFWTPQEELYLERGVQAFGANYKKIRDVVFPGHGITNVQIKDKITNIMKQRAPNYGVYQVIYDHYNDLKE